MKCANQISNLKQSITGRFYVLREFNRAADSSFKNLMEHSGNWSLAAIVVYLDALKRVEKLPMRENKIVQGGLKFRDDLICRCNEFLINAQTMILIIDFSGERHHTREYPSAQLAAKHGIVLLASNKGTGVKAMTLKTDFSIRSLQTNNLWSDINRLIVKNHAYDVKPRFRIRETKVSRFVNKDTKRFRFHRQCLKKERVAGFKSYHSRGVLSPHPGDPSQ